MIWAELTMPAAPSAWCGQPRASSACTRRAAPTGERGRWTGWRTRRPGTGAPPGPQWHVVREAVHRQGSCAPSWRSARSPCPGRAPGHERRPSLAASPARERRRRTGVGPRHGLGGTPRSTPCRRPPGYLRNALMTSESGPGVRCGQDATRSSAGERSGLKVIGAAPDRPETARASARPDVRRPSSCGGLQSGTRR